MKFFGFILLLLILTSGVSIPEVKAQDTAPEHRIRIQQEEPAAESLPLEEKKERSRINEEQAEKFFIDCLYAQDPLVSPDAQELTCACMTAELIAVMTPEEYEITNEDSSEGRAAMNKLQIFVLAPCMEEIVREHAYQDCLADRELINMEKETNRDVRTNVCGCAADQTQYQIAIDAPDIVTKNLKHFPDKIDTLFLIMQSNSYQRIYAKYKNQCMSLHEYED